jgi:hypothetical protein
MDYIKYNPNPTQTNPDQSRPIQTNPDQSRPIQTNPDQSRENLYIKIDTRI